MSLITYLKEKRIAIFLFAIVIGICVALLSVFRVNTSCIIAEVMIMLVAFIIVLTADYWKRNKFYKDFITKLENLDQKYLITEMLGEAEFEEAVILKESIYEIDKSMKEKVNQLNRTNEEFKEYLEMWIHEIKRPLSALTLMNYNGNMDEEKQKVLIKKIEHYVEQILFLARADAAEKDYLMKRTVLEKCVNKAIVSNKEILLESHVSVEREQLGTEVVTDAKWLEFILGQIISNSVKYVKNNERTIKFSALENSEDKKTILVVEDNGIGIPQEDVPRIFEKSFTGSNGHTNEKATGMGLYICKKLCNKMGNKIWAQSKEGEYTKIYIEFGWETYFANR